MIKTDILIIGAGPVGLFAVFEAGLLKMKCHLIDILPKAGGQCIELYPKKPIYDIPGYPEILAGDLINNLIEQGRQFEPGYTLGEKAEKLENVREIGHFMCEFSLNKQVRAGRVVTDLCTFVVATRTFWWTLRTLPKPDRSWPETAKKAYFNT